MIIEELNDFEKQEQHKNLKILKQVRYENRAADCINGIKAFQEIYFQCYKETELTKNLFLYALAYMETLASFPPQLKTRKKR